MLSRRRDFKLSKEEDLMAPKQSLWIIIGMLFLCSLGLSQFDDKEDVAKFKIYKSYDSIHPGMTMRIAVKVTIRALWHINSNEPSEDYMIGTNIDVSAAAFELKEIVYPEPEELLLGFSDKPLSVYEGEVYIGAVIPIAADTELGEYKIPVHIIYQACNDASCLPPRSVKKEISIVVVDPETPIKEIHKDIFAKLHVPEKFTE
jgi:hypothetical protein